MIFFDLDGTLLDFKGAEYRGVLAFYDKYQSSYGLKEFIRDLTNGELELIKLNEKVLPT